MPHISDFYRPLKQHHSISDAEVLEDRLRVLAYGQLPYEHSDEANYRGEVTSVAGYLQSRLKFTEIAGRAILSEYRLAADDNGVINFSIAGPENHATDFSFETHGKISSTQTRYNNSPDSPLTSDISDRPYAIGRALVTALDVCRYKDAQALAFEKLLDVLKVA